MKRYYGFGQMILSNIDLPEFFENGAGVSNLQVKHRFGLPETNPKFPEGYSHIQPGRAFLNWPDFAEYTVSRGEISVVAKESTNQELVRLPLIGTVMAAALQLQGCLVLHGSVVELGGKGFVFVGDSGQGKSTTAVSLLSEGATLYSDDVAALWRDQDGYTSFTGHRHIKLSKEAYQAFSPEGEVRSDKIHPSVDKLRITSSIKNCEGPLGIAAVYNLKRGERTRSLSLSKNSATKVILSNQHIARYGAAGLALTAPGQQLELIAKLCETVPVKTLEIASSFANLTDVKKVLAAEHDL